MAVLARTQGAAVADEVRKQSMGTCFIFWLEQLVQFHAVVLLMQARLVHQVKQGQRGIIPVKRRLAHLHCHRILVNLAAVVVFKHLLCAQKVNWGFYHSIRHQRRFLGAFMDLIQHVLLLSYKCFCKSLIRFLGKQRSVYTLLSSFEEFRYQHIASTRPLLVCSQLLQLWLNEFLLLTLCEKSLEKRIFALRLQLLQTQQKALPIATFLSEVNFANRLALLLSPLRVFQVFPQVLKFPNVVDLELRTHGNRT